MIRKIAIALLCTVLGSSLYADGISEAKGFIGLEVGAATVQADTFTELGREGDAVEYGIRIGAQTNEWRSMLLFDYYDSSDDDQNMEKGYFMLDYFFLKSETSSFKPFVGLNFGYVNYESTLVEDDGLLYGGQAGFIINVAETIDLDLSYRYSLSGAEALDNTGSVVFGVNYLY